MAKTTKTALAEVRAYAEALERSKKLTQEMEKSFGEVANTIAGLSMDDFFEEVSKTDAEIKKATEDFKSAFKELNKESLKFGKKLKTEIFDSADGLQKSLKDALDAGLLDEDIFKKIQEAKGDAGKLAMIYGKYAKELDPIFASSGKMTEETRKQASNYLEMQAEAAKLKKELEETSKIEFNFIKPLLKLSENIIKSVIPTLSDLKSNVFSMDQTLTESQRNSGIEMKKNYSAMQSLGVSTSVYGVSLAQAAGFMTNLGDALNTTNFNLLKNAAEDTKAISVATGLSYENVGQLTNSFMLAGKSSKSVTEFTEKAMKDSAKFGLNVKKVLEDVNRNYMTFRKLGFQGGEESLKRMVITAQRLRMNVDEIFNVAQRARTIEGAMEMAAELQLAGGSFAQIDPMQLLAAARRSPEELTKILGKMGKDIGEFDKKTGEVKFDPVDADRLAMVAQATGLTVESLQNQITKGKQRIEKEGQGLFSGFSGGLDSETKDMLDQFSTLGSDGKIKFEGAFEGMDINELRGMTQAQIKSKIDEYNQNKKSLEEQAKQNQAFTESITNFKTSLLNAISVFQPLLNKLTNFIVGINQNLTEGQKMFIGGLGLLFVTFLGPLAMIAKGYLMGKGFNMAVQGGSMFKALTSGIKGMFGFGGGGSAPPATNPTSPATSSLSTMDSEKIKAIGKAAGAAAPGLLAFGAAILMIGGGIAIASLGMSKLVESFSNLTGEQIAGALGALLITMGGFTAMVIALGSVSTAVAPGLLTLGGAILMIGAGIGIAAVGMSLLVESFSKLDAKSLSGVGDGLFNFAKGLGALALASVAFGNPITLLTFGLMVGALGSLAFVMSTLGPSLEAGGKGINAMAEGVDKLSTALSKISDDTLDKLKAIGESLGDAAALTAAVNALNTATSGGGGGGTPQKFQIEVIVKNENGREIQRKIVKDTDLLK